MGFDDQQIQRMLCDVRQLPREILFLTATVVDIENEALTQWNLLDIGVDRSIFFARVGPASEGVPEGRLSGTPLADD